MCGAVGAKPLLCALLLFVVKRDSAEFVITVLSLCIGLTLMLLVSLFIWYINR